MQSIPMFFPAVLKFGRSEDGVSIIEFALVGALIATICVIGFIALGKLN